jgi:hypothetical protein
MSWEIEHTDEFEEWWHGLTDNEQNDVAAIAELLEEKGVNLRYPHTSGIEGSKHDHMRELRIQSGGDPLRVYYAFDPRRTAILLIGGDKTGNDRFYEEYTPIADRLYDEYIEEIRKEGLIK